MFTGDLIRHIRTAPDFPLLEPVLQRAVGVLVGLPSDAGRKLLQRIVLILGTLQQSLHQAALEQQAAASEVDAPKAPPPLSETQKATLQAYLRRRFPDDAELEIEAVKPITGGGSKKTLILRLRNTSRLPERVVIRADSATGVVESTVADEYQLIETVFAAGMPVPQPFACESDITILGAPFIVVSCIEGRNVGDHMDVYEPSETFALGIARALAKLHGIPPERFGTKVAGANVSARERTVKEIAAFETVWRNSGCPSVWLELAYSWLKEHIDFADGRRALNHGDVGCHNLLCDGGQLTAVLDWETAFIGNPAYDLGYAYPEIVQMTTWERFIAEYEKSGGVVPSPAELDFYRLWAAVCKVGYLFVARSYFHSGISNALILAFAAQHLYQRGEYQLQSVLNEIYTRH